MDHPFFIVCSFTENSIGLKRVNPFLTGKHQTDILTNCVDPDTMSQNVQTHQGLTCFLGLKKHSSGTETQFHLKLIIHDLLKYIIVV